MWLLFFLCWCRWWWWRWRWAVDGKLELVWKLSAAQKLKLAGNKSGRSFAQFFSEAQIPPGLCVCVLVLLQFWNIFGDSPASSETGAVPLCWNIFAPGILVNAKVKFSHLIWDGSPECARLRGDHRAHLRPLLAEVSRPDQCIVLQCITCNAANGRKGRNG